MPARKKTKALKVLSRNSYRGRIMGTLPAYESGRCQELRVMERLQVERVHAEIVKLLTMMEAK